MKNYQQTQRELSSLIRAFRHAFARRNASLAAAHAVKPHFTLGATSYGIYRKHIRTHIHWHHKSNRILHAIVLLRHQWLWHHPLDSRQLPLPQFSGIPQWAS
jgi:hypothetical protein